MKVFKTSFYIIQSNGKLSFNHTLHFCGFKILQTVAKCFISLGKENKFSYLFIHIPLYYWPFHLIPHFPNTPSKLQTALPSLHMYWFPPHFTSPPGSPLSPHALQRSTTELSTRLACSPPLLRNPVVHPCTAAMFAKHVFWPDTEPPLQAECSSLIPSQEEALCAHWTDEEPEVQTDW